MPKNLTLQLLSAKFAVAQLNPQASIPDWALAGQFSSITKTSQEISIVAQQDLIPSDIKTEKDWCALIVEGPLDFALTGILAQLLVPLAEAKISVFTISTFDTDYILIKEKDIENALKILRINYKVNHEK